MVSENVLELNDGNFQQEVLESDQPVMVDVWAAWCAPCRAVAPTVEALADDYAGRVKIGKVDADTNHEVSDRYQVSSIPTLLFFKDGQLVKRVVGVRPQQELAAELDALIA